MYHQRLLDPEQGCKLVLPIWLCVVCELEVKVVQQSRQDDTHLRVSQVPSQTGPWPETEGLEGPSVVFGEFFRSAVRDRQESLGEEFLGAVEVGRRVVCCVLWYADCGLFILGQSC